MAPGRWVSAAVLLFITLQESLFVDCNQIYDWTVSFAQRKPLGVEKPVIVINDEFPGPLLSATTNDVVTVNVHNNLTEPLLLTWNGIQQRRNPWQDGVQGTNCPIPPGANWTYEFQVKDQIGSFFYYPSFLFHKASGGYGPVRVYNRVAVPTPFPTPMGDFDVLVGDWYNADHRDLQSRLDQQVGLPPNPDGVLINGLASLQTSFTLKPGGTYRFRISNVGLKATINLKIQDHMMQLIEAEGAHTLKEYYDNLDVHVGQSYSVLVTANKDLSKSAFYMVASTRFTAKEMVGLAILNYEGHEGQPEGLFPFGPDDHDFSSSIEQAFSIRWDPRVGAARPNPQGSFHYGLINVSRTIVLENNVAMIGNQLRYTINGISFVYPETPMLLANYFGLKEMENYTRMPDVPDYREPQLGSSLLDLEYRSFVHFVFQNSELSLQTWHFDGYSVFIVGMGEGRWTEKERVNYNMFDAISRSTFQVYPNSWTAVMVEMDNYGVWNLRSQDGERRYLGQELYLRVKGNGTDSPGTIPARDMRSIPPNAIKCGMAH
ncbi:hypothetical protein H6P81_018458 [Aristolochia fimbriata]|uniref:Uncharacterized protein n=1 Tax=Aristolochia fimbriata TaxID=158543 RepID=A0AAV7E2C8_ARIFI|nr:hypothetical protein H6P81_018458 [Aristolochia fimbriata]